MMRVPYHGDPHARRAAVKRGFYYGSAGLIDPRTFTIDPWLLVRSTGMSYRSAVAYSLRFAGATGLAMATAGFLGWDPMNVTPGYGYGPGNHPERNLIRDVMV